MFCRKYLSFSLKLLTLNTDHQSSVVELGCNFRAFSVWSFGNAEIQTDINSEVLDSLLAKLSTFDISSHFFFPLQLKKRLMLSFCSSLVDVLTTLFS